MNETLFGASQLDAHIDLEVLAQRFGTPCFVYSQAAMVRAWNDYARPFLDQGALVCYAVKANPLLAILQQFQQLGSGFDVVSGGELARVLRAGGAAEKIVFSGVGKSTGEITQALEVGIKSLNVESREELLRIERLASQRKQLASVAIRINPQLDIQTHSYITTGHHGSKFGVDGVQANAFYAYIRQSQSLRAVGISAHLGSQIADETTFITLFAYLRDFILQLRAQGTTLEFVDIGGGFAIAYRATESVPAISRIAAAAREHFSDLGLQIVVEPGRALIAHSGLLLTRAEYLKSSAGKHFVIVDAAMNDLLRPALYQAYHRISTVSSQERTPLRCYDIVGPICESADFLAHDRELSVLAGDLLVIHDCGAYAQSMASNYNSRNRAAAILIHGNQKSLIRAQESVEQQWNMEKLL